MLYMIVEHFRGNADRIYRRVQEQGRQIPDGLRYLDSWVRRDLDGCYQLMEGDDPALLREWMSRWEDLVHFEVHEVISSAEAGRAAGSSR